ncbi:hypothetical protein PTKIN_Ptkin01aG0154800 [Pterospermum kingtungense]
MASTNSSVQTPLFPVNNSWRKLFEDEDQSLKYNPPQERKGETIIAPPNEVFERGIDRWKNALVIQFIGRIPNFSYFQKMVNTLWGAESAVDLRSAGSNLFIVQFSNAMTRDKVLENGPWYIQNMPIIVRKWEPGMSSMVFNMSTVPVWFKLSNVPLEHFSQEGLGFIASGLGNPLYMDQITAKQQRLSYARVCVEIVAGKSIPRTLKVQMRDGGYHSVDVEIPWIPPSCGQCSIFGHSEKNCPKKVHQAWVPKKSDVVEERVTGTDKRKVTEDGPVVEQVDGVVSRVETRESSGKDIEGMSEKTPLISSVVDSSVNMKHKQASSGLKAASVNKFQALSANNVDEEEGYIDDSVSDVSDLMVATTRDRAVKIGAAELLKAKGGDKARRMSVDGRVSVGIERPFNRMYMWESDGDGNDLGEVKRDLGCELPSGIRHDDINSKFNLKLPLKAPKPGKRQGETISKGHRNYELMLNLQLGIRHSVGRPAPATALDLKASAFDPNEKIWTRFPPEGSKYTPPHQSCEFKWKDYCPIVFRTLRKLFKVDPADYMLSICGNDALRELSSPGKSGSFFYLTDDDRYMIKTMKKAEVKVRFIIMGNLLRSEYTIHRRFDLKGSSLGRITEKLESEIDDTTILKDLDLNFMFKLQKAWFQEFCRQINKDCEFLEQERTMDYNSLLVGLHFREISSNGELIPRGRRNSEDESSTPRFSRTDMDQLHLDPKRLRSIKLGANMPARVERTIRKPECEFQLVGEQTGEFYEVIMFFGIIDILQDYDITKKLEHAYKSIHYDPTSISAVDPKLYSKRFRDSYLKFLLKILIRTFQLGRVFHESS